jgi:hypothetical protein
MNRYRVYFRVGSKTYWRTVDAPNAAEAKLALERSFWVLKAERPVDPVTAEIHKSREELEPLLEVH